MKDTSLLKENLTKNNFLKGKLYVLKPIAMIAIITTSLIIVNFSPIGDYFKPSKFYLLKEKLADFHLFAPLVFVMISSLLISAGIPRSTISVFGGMVFGFIWGTLLSTFSAFIGSLITFYIVRYMGRPYFYNKFGDKVSLLEKKIKENGFLVVVVLRQSPLTCLLVNILIGLSPIKAKTFVIGSVLGFLPEAAIFTLFGSSVRENFVLRIVIASIFLILLIIFVRYFYKKSKFANEIKDLIKDIKKGKEIE
jgi:uncharacterized membrane protein YdjX (TVP38/TMEM64 family)